jgi:hypothetical protein
MTLRTRRKIFYTLVALFFVLGTGVVLYAQGWRLDFSTWHFEKIGGVYVRTYPSDATIYLNGTFVPDGAGFLSPGTLISDLLPRTYTISLRADGYDAWQENASVEPAQVVQFKYAVLVPSGATSTPSSTWRALLAAEPTSTTVDPFDAAQKIAVVSNATSSNNISIYNIAQGTTTASMTVPGKNLEVKWITPSLVGILQNDGELYLYNTNTAAAAAGTGNGSQAPRTLADDVKDFAASADGSMVAALEGDSLEIFSLTDSSIYYRFNIPDVTAASRVIWYKDDNHLFIVYPDSVSFLDLADSALVNFITVAQGTKPLYDPAANIFYITAPSGQVVQYNFPS